MVQKLPTKIVPFVAVVGGVAVIVILYFVRKGKKAGQKSGMNPRHGLDSDDYDDGSDEEDDVF